MEHSRCLDKEVIDLKRWMKRNGWNNETKLKLREFSSTGRGVSSTKSFNEGEAIIEIPLPLLITCDVVAKSGLMGFIEGDLKTHELLALFLVYERHKGVESEWFEYIKSLPGELPEVFWVLEEGEFKKLFGNDKYFRKNHPDVNLNESITDLIKRVEKCRKEYLESVERVEKSIRKTRCFHCEENTDRVFDVNLFTWGYVMVNTRAVHVDPGVISPRGRISLDDPGMALCPYLDMFNHSDKANTTVAISSNTYKLITMTPQIKYEQIFISYGPHDNNKLISEYGFFIPFNKYDVIKFDFVKISKGLKIETKIYKYLKEKGFDKDLNISQEGLSFNLKALLYIALNANKKDWSHTIYTSNYTESDLRGMYSLTLNWLKDFPEELKITDGTKTLLTGYFNYLKIFRLALIDSFSTLYL